MYTNREIKRWLTDGDTPYEIGGRSTDFSVLASSLMFAIKSYFPPNEIPDEVLNDWTHLKKELDDAEVLLNVFISRVTGYALVAYPPETS